EPDTAVGLHPDHAPNLELGIADGNALALCEVQDVEQALLDDGPPDATLERECIGERRLRVQLHFAVEGVDVVDCLEFDEPAIVSGAGHRAHLQRFGDPPCGAEAGELLGRRFPISGPYNHIPASQPARIAREAVLDGTGKRTDAGNGGDAEGEAGKEDPKALQPAAQLTAREGERERQAADHGHAPATRASTLRSSAVRPSAIPTILSQRSARAGSCVIRSSVAPRWAERSNRTSMTLDPVAPSRLPVG